MQKNISWYISRIRKMSYLELLYRSYEAFFYLVDTLFFKSGWKKSNNDLFLNELSSKLGRDLLNKKNFLMELYPSEYTPSNLPFDNNLFFKKLKLEINYDIRNYWESQRFNNLLAKAFKTNNQKEIIDFLKLWMVENKPLKGVNYISTMECAIRCINLYAALCILAEKERLSNELHDLSCNFFYSNYRIIRHRISKFSSRGNHTLFEYAGLVVCSTLVAPKEKYFWVDKCLKEFDYQTLADGAGVEQSTAYHLFNVEVAWLIQKYFTNEHISSEKLDIALLFCAKFWTGTELIRIGDSDSSMLFSRVFIRNELSRLEKREASNVNYSDCGVVIFENDQLRGYFKYGSLGLAPLYGHGHYDFLSLILVDGFGKLITADAQTYLYNTPRREQFRSSSYHSMPFCGPDDIEQINKFSWADGGCGNLTTEPENNWISATYCRSDGTTIKRSVKLTDETLIVLDQLVDTAKQNSLTTQWLLLNRERDFQFYTVDEHNKINQIMPVKKKLDGSSLYGSLEKKVITQLKATASENEKMVTVISLHNHDGYKSLRKLVENTNLSF